MVLFPNIRHLSLEFFSEEWSAEAHASTPDRSLFSHSAFPRLRTVELLGELPVNGVTVCSNAFLGMQPLLTELTIDHARDLPCLGTSSSLRGLWVRQSIHDDNLHEQPFCNRLTSLSILRILHRSLTHRIGWPGVLNGISCLEICLCEIANVMMPSMSESISNNINQLVPYLYPDLMELGVVVHVASHSFFNGFVVDKCVSTSCLVRITLFS